MRDGALTLRAGEQDRLALQEATSVKTDGRTHGVRGLTRSSSRKLRALAL